MGAVTNVTPLARNRQNATARPAAPSPTPSRIYLIGTMRAFGPGGESILPPARKAQAVLAYLCLAREERVFRSHIAGMVWDRSGEAQARDNLRHALTEIAQAGPWRLQMDHNAVHLDLTACWIDAFEGPDRSELLIDNLYGISSQFDQWLIGERTRFENRWQSGLEKALNDLVENNAAPELRAEAARKLLNFVPTHERALRSLMSAFVDLSDPAQAIREYERFRLVIKTSLGMRPSDKTVALYDAIRFVSRPKVGSSLSTFDQLTC